MKNDQVVGIGEALWDMLPEGRKIGGAPANFAYHMSQFGFEATAVSAVGRDPLGDGIVAEFDARGLHHDLARVEYPTGTVDFTIMIAFGFTRSTVSITASTEEVSK